MKRFGVIAAGVLGAFVLLFWPLMAGGATVRTDNFVLTAAIPADAQHFADLAERARHDLAIWWLGKPLPNWPNPCPVRITVDRSNGGGATQIVYRQGGPPDFKMSCRGSRQRLADDVIPHEVSHTILHSHFRGPFSRVLDEGACGLIESPWTYELQRKEIARYIKQRRTVPLRLMLRMEEYPRDILPLYSQGYWLARMLVAEKGQATFLAFIKQGTERDAWDQAALDHYGDADVRALQARHVKWLAPQVRPGPYVAGYPPGDCEGVTCDTQTPPHPRWAVRVTSFDDARYTSHGSGALVDHDADFSYWLTCYHELRDNQTGRFQVASRYLRPRAAQVVAYDVKNDVALLRTERVPIEAPGYEDYRQGDVLTAGGFGSNNQWRTVGGPVQDWTAETPHQAAHPILPGRFRSGDSGGPIYNRRGCLVGIGWGSRDGQTYGTVGGPVRRLLAKVFPRLAARRQAAAAAQAAAGQQHVQQQPAPRYPIGLGIPPARPAAESRPLEPVPRTPSAPAAVVVDPPASLPRDDPVAVPAWPEPPLHASTQQPEPAAIPTGVPSEETLRDRLRDKAKQAAPAAASWGVSQVIAAGLSAGGPIGLGVAFAGWFLRKKRASTLGDGWEASPTLPFPSPHRRSHTYGTTGYRFADSG